MQETAYRDGLAGRKAVLAELEGHFEAARARVSAFDRALWPSQVRDDIELRERLVAELPRDTFEEMSALEPVVVAATAALESTFEDNALRRSAPALATYEPGPDPRPYLIEELWMQGLRAALQQFAGPKATVRRLGDATYASEWVEGTMPVGARVGLAKTDDSLLYTDTEVRIAVPRGIPDLRIGPEGVLHRLGSWLGVVHEVEIGHADFDAAFLVQAPREIAMLLLDDGARRALLGQVQSAPVITLRDGHAVVRWANPTTAAFVERALDHHATIARELHRRLGELVESR